MGKRRVVITALGVKSSIGNDVSSFFNSLKNGKHGIRPISFFDASNLNVKLASYDYDFDPLDYFMRKDLKRMDRFSQLALAATQDALGEQKILDYYDPYKVGVIFSSGIGGITTIEKEHSNIISSGENSVSVFFIPKMISNMAAGLVSIKTGFKGDNISISTACASSTHAVGEAFRKIRDGYLDACLTGGTESGISELTVSGFSNMKALTTEQNANRASIPFDKERSGFVIGEGAAALFLEELQMAKKRGAKIYGEIVGYGASCDAFHITKPNPDGQAQAKCIVDAINDAGILPSLIDYVNAHGTSTKLNDAMETKAIKIAFGAHAKKLLISSTKSMTGHMLGAAGAVEAVATLLSIEKGIVFPTVGLKEKDEECDLFYVPEVSIKKDLKYAVSSSFGFGGHNACICFKKFE